MTIAARLAELPEMPKSYLDGNYESEPTAVRHALRARLSLALEVLSKCRDGILPIGSSGFGLMRDIDALLEAMKELREPG